MVGDGNKLIFREMDAALPPFDGHHVQIALVDFSGPHKRLLERGLITEESDQHQYRFQDIIDVDSGKVLFTVEHEVRSMRHPMYTRPLVNRNRGDDQPQLHAPATRRRAGRWNPPDGPSAVRGVVLEQPLVIVVMGVSGSGKTTIAQGSR